MICPKCQKTAMSFLRFAFMIDPRSLYCDHCGAQLRLSPHSVRVWWSWLIIGCVVVITSVILRRMIGWGLLTNLIGIIALAVFFSWCFWRSAVYQLKEQGAASAPDLELP